MELIKHYEYSEATSEQIVQALKDDGCVVLENAISPEQHTQLKDEMDFHLAKTPVCKGDFYGYSTKRMGTLFNKSDIYVDMALKSKILDVMDEFLLPGCSDYQINLTQAISIGQGEPQQIFHQDDPMFPFLHEDQEIMINCMWAVDDFTADNGATLLVPGSHKWERKESLNLLDDLSEDKIVSGEMKKGSVLLWLGSLFHAGGHNKTPNPRCGAVISYSLGWLRQAENSYLGYSMQDLSKMPDRLKKLLGYFVHKPNLGSIDGLDPLTFIRNDREGEVFTEFLPEEVVPAVQNYRQEQIRKNELVA